MTWRDTDPLLAAVQREASHRGIDRERVAIHYTREPCPGAWLLIQDEIPYWDKLRLCNVVAYLLPAATEFLGVRVMGPESFKARRVK